LEIKKNQSVDNLAKSIQEDIIIFINDKWYQSRTNNGEFYERTFDLLNCVEIKRDDNGGVKIFLDVGKIRTDYTPVKGMWLQHRSMKPYGKDVHEYLPLWIDKGQKSSMYDYKGIDISGYIQRDLIESGQIINDLIKYLKLNGIMAYRI
jgi:hypothetical protein